MIKVPFIYFFAANCIIVLFDFEFSPLDIITFLILSLINIINFCMCFKNIKINKNNFKLVIKTNP